MELKRIFTNKKMIFVTLLLLIVTAGLFLWNEFNSISGSGYSLTDKVKYKNEIENIVRSCDTQKARDLLDENLSAVYDEQQENLENEEYDASLNYKEDVLNDCISQLEYISSYNEYIDGILENVNNLTSISIFQNTDSFAALNIEKTKSDYEKIQGTEVEYGNYNATTAVMNYDSIHYIIFIFMFMVVWSFFEDDKKGLKTIFYATKNGRFQLTLQRIGVLCVSSVIFTFCAYALTFLSALILYGGMGDLNNSIQSIEMFKDCLFSVSVIQYMFIYVFIHAAITFAMALFMWTILMIFRNKLLSMGVLLSVVGIEAVLNINIISQSTVVFLKYENIFCFINPSEILNSYRNYMLFGHIVNCFRTFIVTVLFTIIVCVPICVAISVKRKPVSGKTKLEIILLRALRKINSGYQYVIAKFSLLGMEIYKVLIVQKGIIFIAVWLYLLLSTVDTTRVTYMGTSAVMQEVYAEYSGPVDDGLQKFVDENEVILTQTDEGNDSLRACVDIVKNKLLYINNLKEEKNIDAWFVNDKGYKIMWTGDGLYTGAGYTSQETNALFAIILLILLLSTVFSYDVSCGMHNMLHATAGGREKLFYKKIKMAIIFCLGICIVTYGIELYEVNKIYPLTCLNAPIQSLEFMKDFPLKINILGFLVLVEIIHFVTLLAISMVIYMLSLYFKGYYSVIVSFVVLVVPSAIFMLGMKWCEYISAMQPVVYVEALQEHGIVYSTTIIFIEIMVGFISYCIAKKRFCK